MGYQNNEISRSYLSIGLVKIAIGKLFVFKHCLLAMFICNYTDKFILEYVITKFLSGI